MQHRFSVVGDVGISARSEESLGDLNARLQSCLGKRRVAPLVRTVQVGIVPGKRPYGFRLVLLYRKVERSPILRRPVHRSTCPDQKIDYVHLVTSGRVMQRGKTAGVAARPGVCSALNKRFDHLPVATGHGEVERREIVEAGCS